MVPRVAMVLALRGRVALGLALAGVGCRAEPAAAPEAVPVVARSPAARHEEPAPPAAPTESAEGRAAHAVAVAHVLPDGVDPYAQIVGEARPWRFEPVTPPASLARFHAALADAGARPVRVAMFGASGTAADTHTAYVRAYLQARFGDGGPGWVPLGRAKRWSRHAEVAIRSSEGWQVLHAVAHRDGSVLALGPQGLAFEAKSSRAWVELASRPGRAQTIRSIELVAMTQPRGGTLRVQVDGGAPIEHTTRAEVTAILRIPIAVAPGPHTIRVALRGDGPVRLFGAALESGAGVVVDTLGVDGARARNWQRWDPAIWRDAVATRPPALVTIAYGTNEAVDLDRPIAAFVEDYALVLERVRQTFPDADCLVLGPGDFPERVGDTWVARPRLGEIVTAVRGLAADHGCGFWDELAFMGGAGSMVRWVQSDPPLAREDHLHFRPLGAAVKGHELVDALVLGYDAAAP